jgi:uncharacterized MAPEG superfamily protein
MILGAYTPKIIAKSRGVAAGGGNQPVQPRSRNSGGQGGGGRAHEVEEVGGVEAFAAFVVDALE